MSNTREQLLSTATAQFADRGFYGTSIASIAAGLGLTKQALLHHFGSKEKLYAEILSRLSERALRDLESARKIPEPEKRLEEAIVLRYLEHVEQNDEARLLMRELLDNEPRAATAGNWYLKPYLEGLVELLREVPSASKLPKADAFALVYQLLGAANYFAVSQPTLKHMFGQKFFRQTEAVFADRLRDTVRRAVAM